MSHGFDADGYLDVLARDADALMAAARARGPEAAIQACPGWTVNDLTAHLGMVYRFVGAFVRQQRTTPLTMEDRAAFADPDPADVDGVVARLVTASGSMLAALRDAPADLDCWTTWPVSSSARDFWIRRMVCETLVHRVDAEDDGTAGPTLGQTLDPAVAADAIDEMVCGFAQRYTATLRAEAPVLLTLQPTDAPGRWWIGIGPEEPAFGAGPAPGEADAHVEGAAGELALLLWNRRTADGLSVAGDPAGLAGWRAGAHL
jgi:uncharacterized protein (TIGR03083 family)